MSSSASVNSFFYFKFSMNETSSYIPGPNPWVKLNFTGSVGFPNLFVPKLGV